VEIVRILSFSQEGDDGQKDSIKLEGKKEKLRKEANLEKKNVIIVRAVDRAQKAGDCLRLKIKFRFPF